MSKASLGCSVGECAHAQQEPLEQKQAQSHVFIHSASPQVLLLPLKSLPDKSRAVFSLESVQGTQ